MKGRDGERLNLQFEFADDSSAQRSRSAHQYSNIITVIAGFKTKTAFKLATIIQPFKLCTDEAQASLRLTDRSSPSAPLPNYHPQSLGHKSTTSTPSSDNFVLLLLTLPLHIAIRLKVTQHSVMHSNKCVSLSVSTRWQVQGKVDGGPRCSAWAIGSTNLVYK